MVYWLVQRHIFRDREEELVSHCREFGIPHGLVRALNSLASRGG